MLAYRTTWIVKPNCMQAALELLKAEVERSQKRLGNLPGKARIYTPHISPNALVFETTFETTQAQEEYWAVEYDGDSQESRTFWEKWYEVVERDAGTEIWTLTEWQ
jgi:hypothetical protein